MSDKDNEYPKCFKDTFDMLKRGFLLEKESLLFTTQDGKKVLLENTGEELSIMQID